MKKKIAIGIGIMFISVFSWNAVAVAPGTADYTYLSNLVYQSCQNEYIKQAIKTKSFTMKTRTAIDMICLGIANCVAGRAEPRDDHDVEQEVKGVMELVKRCEEEFREIAK